MPQPPLGPRASREEIANTLTHLLGLLLGVAGLVLLVVFSVRHGATIHVVSTAVFGGSVVLLYLASTLYHATRDPGWKRRMQMLDHTCIYVLIAGTYTPFCLAILGGAWGWTLFGIAWGLALLGIVYKLFLLGRYPNLSTALYLGMGWLGVVAILPTIDAVPGGGIALLLAGGLAYTAGVGFYQWDWKIPFGHAIWHLFVMMGTALHWTAVFEYAIPWS